MKTVKVSIVTVLLLCLAVSGVFAAKMGDKQTHALPTEIQELSKEITERMNPSSAQTERQPAGVKSSRSANEPAAASQTPENDDKGQYVTMDFDGVDIQMLIKFIADLTKKNFIVDNNVNGKVTVVSPRKMTTSEAYKVFESVLEVNGFTTVPMSGITKIMRSTDAMSKGIETKIGIDAPKQDKLVTQIIQLKYTDAEDMKNLLTPLMGKGASQILAYSQSNLLIITDTLSNIRKLLDILKVVDVKGFGQDVKIIPLKNASASDLATKLTEILSDNNSGRTVRRSVRQTTTNTVTKEAPKIIAYERTNSLIVMASSIDSESIESLIRDLDVPTPSGKEDIHVYYLQYATAEDVAKVLSALPVPASPDAAASTSTTKTTSTKSSSNTTNQGFTVAPDSSTNSLIIFADPYTYNTVVETIKYLDIPRKQVYVQALIMEVNTSKTIDFGVQWQAFKDFSYDDGDREGGLFLRTGSSTLSATNLPSGALLGVIGEAITVGSGDYEVTFPNIASFINAMKTDSDVKIISTPQIITMDNKEAEIKVGKNVPYVTREDTDATNSDRTVRTYDYRDVGVHLKFTPQINQQDNILMDLYQEITQLVSGTGEDEYAPTTLKRTAQTTVMVKDGSTMVIGGLIGEDLELSKSRVPLLGDIPILGYLFKSISRSRDRTNLFIFLTPIIIDASNKADALYQEKYHSMMQSQEAFDKGKHNTQVDKNYGVYKPEPAKQNVPEEEQIKQPSENAPEKAPSQEELENDLSSQVQQMKDFTAEEDITSTQNQNKDNETPEVNGETNPQH